MPRVLAVHLILLATLRTALASPGNVEVLLRAGDAAADGTRVGVIDGLSPVDGSGVLFRGRTTAIMVDDGTTRRTLAATGVPIDSTSGTLGGTRCLYPRIRGGKG